MTAGRDDRAAGLPVLTGSLAATDRLEAAEPQVYVVGSLNIDALYEVAAIPRPGETVIASNSAEMAGGKGGNQAVGAARLGAAVTMIACVGADPAGDRALAALVESGVDVHAVGRREGPTGAATVLVAPDAENVIIVSPGANHLLMPADVLAALPRSPSGVVLISLEIPLATAAAAAAAASAAGLTVVLNPAPARVLGTELLRACDVLVPNEHEVGSLGQPDVASLLAAGVGAVVVTRGARGAQIHRLGHPVATVGAFTVDTVDTTGAGDAFCAGLAWALAGGSDLDSAVLVASAAGALATRARGARASLADAHDVAGLLGSRDAIPS